MIPLKTRHEISQMREAGKILAAVMKGLSPLVVPGAATKELDEAAEKMISAYKVRSAFKGYRGYPASICVSVNEEVVHGIPGDRRLKEGDIAGIDIGIEKGGFFVDMARTFAVGRVDPLKRKLIETTEASLREAIKAFKAGGMLGDISRAVQRYVEDRGFSIVRDFVGHGIGRELHEEPQIPNYALKDEGPELEVGMVFAVEPMVNAGTWEVKVLNDGWTAVTKDKKPSAHFEHTLALTEEGVKVLTE